MYGRKQWKTDRYVLLLLRSLGIFGSQSGVNSAIHEAALKLVPKWLLNQPSGNSL